MGLRQWGCVYRKGVLPFYIEIFLEIPHDVAQEKNLDVFIFPLLTNMCYKRTVEMIDEMIEQYEMIGIARVLTVVIVIIAVLIIHANNKYST